MLRTLAVCLGLVGSFGALPLECSAARIYRILEYPELQQGYRLTGSITTTDHAHQDGTLDGEEILDWQWAVSGPEEFGFASGAGSSLSFQGIGITEDAILLPQAETASAYLRGTVGTGRATSSYFLRWYGSTDASDGHYYYSSVLHGIIEGDIATTFWYGERPSESGDAYVIARTVPEPAASVLLAGTLWLYVASRRSPRQG